ncbi:MAG: hypothetical protein WCZ90_04335 [Melioribacteraceae bacterium]
MEITFGVHKGKTSQIVFLKEPNYVQWVLNKNSIYNDLLIIKNNFRYLIEILDTKPFKGTCHNCRKPATRLAFWQGEVSSFYYSCDTCDSSSLGADEGQIRYVRTYSDAIKYVGNFCVGKKNIYQKMIKSMASAKGLNGRLTKENAHTFFLPSKEKE